MKGGTTAVRVWDLPTRVFHWVLAGCVVGSVISAKVGGNAMAWHFRLGYAVLALIVFRLLWGVVGGRWSRFASFVRGPSTVWRYLRGASRPDEWHHVGHNPLGAWSVLSLMLVLALQVGTGLFADDEIANTGPLVPLVAGATSSALTSYHKGWGQWLVIGLVALHVLAVVFYLVARRQDLIRPMLTGDKLLHANVPPSIDSWRARGAAALLLSACAAGVAWLTRLGA